jgi:hypothetical protein
MAWEVCDHRLAQLTGTTIVGHHNHVRLGGEADVGVQEEEAGLEVDPLGVRVDKQVAPAGEHSLGLDHDAWPAHVGGFVDE